MSIGQLSLTLWARGWAWAAGAGLLGAVLIVLLSRALIGHPVHYDELLHILSARGLMQTGIPAIEDGVYERAALYTRAVALSFGQFGDGPVVARWPALAAAAALAFLLGGWVTRRVGFLAGSAAALLLCMAPMTIDVAVFARFYTVHAVVVALMYFAAYESLQPDRRSVVRIALALAAVLLTPLAWHFQETTIIATGALLSAVVAVMLVDHWSWVRAQFGRRPAVILGSLGVGALGGVLLVCYLGLLQQLGSTALWGAGNASRFQYYFVEFRNDLPLLWPLLPLAAAMAVLHPAHRRLGLFCSVAVAAGLLVHSVAAQKTMRYVYYLVPLMCILWAISVSNLMRLVLGRYAAKAGGAMPWTPWLALALLATTVLLSQEGARTVNLVAGRVAHIVNLPFADEPDWTPLVPELAPRVQAADRVVTSNSMKALYYLGRYDVELNATIVPETETRAEFGRDRRTGRQAIGTADSIRKVLATPGKTLVVIESSKIGRVSGVTAEAFSVIESHCGELDLPTGTGVRAWWCVTPP